MDMTPVIEIDVRGLGRTDGRDVALSALAEALERGERFAVVLLVPARLTDEEAGGRRLEQLRWLKANRAALAERCAGIGLVMSEELPRGSTKLIAAGSKVIGCPVRACGSTEEAHAWARERLGTSRGREGVTVAVLASSALAFAAAQTMVAPALPAIGQELEVSTTTVSWVLTGFLISASIAPPVLGRLGDLYGKRRMLATTLAIFAAGALICALSQSIALLIAGRVVMGAGGAIFPLAFGILRDQLSAERVPTAIGLTAATFGVGGAAGTILSGLVVDALDYQVLFWIILGVGLAALAVVLAFVPESPVRARGRIDAPGALLLSGWLVALLIAVSEAHAWGWGSARTLGLLAVSALLAGGWIAWQARAADPFIDLRLLSRRAMAVTNASSLLAGFAMFATFIAIPRLVQAPEATGYGFGADVTATGLFLAPAALAMLVGAPVAGALMKRSSRRPLVSGSALLAVGLALLAADHADRAAIYVAMAIFGVGIGLSFAAQGSLTTASVAPHQTGAAGGMNTVIRTVGGALGAQVMASILAAHEPFPTDRAFTVVFALTAVVALGSGVVALGLRRRVSAPR